MSSKDSKGSLDPQPSKSKKKDKEKKESKKEKKEKKEKSKKRDSKNLEKETSNDVDENQIEGNDQESPSAKTKKKFGIFRVSGRKSKGSSDSLKRQSRDSADFDSRSGSEFSLEASTGSMESATAEKGEVSEKVVLDPENESAKAKLHSDTKASNKTEVEEPALADSSPKAKETNDVQADLTEDKGIDKIGVEPVLAESSPKPEETIDVQPDLAKDSSIDKTGAEQADRKDSSPKENSVDNEFQKENLNESLEEAKVQEQNTPPENNDAQLLELEPQSPVISTEPNEDKYEHATYVVSQESARSYEVALEDIKEVHDREITSSEDESVDTVVSAGISNAADVGEIREEAEIGKVNQGGVEKPIISTYKERQGPPQDDHDKHEKDEAPAVDEEAMLLVYPEKQKDQNERQDDPEDEEMPVVLAASKNNENVIPIVEEDISPNFAEETRHVVSSKSAKSYEVALEDIKTVDDQKITSSEKFETINQADKEEAVISTHKVRNVPPQDDSQDEQIQDEAPAKEGTMILVYPDKQKDQNDRQDDPVDDKQPVVIAVNTNKENQVQEQVNEFLKLDADEEERSKHAKSESRAKIVKRREEVGTATEVNKVNELPRKGTDIDDRPEKFKSESSPFDEKTGFTSSTPKKSIDNKKDTRKEAKVEEHKKRNLAENHTAGTGFKTSSVVEVQFRVQFGNTIKEVKMSSTVLLAQLAEINMKLRELRKELLEVLEKGSTTKVSV